MASWSKPEFIMWSTLVFIRSKSSSRGRSRPILIILNGLSVVLDVEAPYRRAFLVRKLEYGLPVV